MEERWMQRAQCGDVEAFEHIVRAYQGYLFQVCMKVVRNHEEAECLVQEAFFSAYRNLSTYKGEGLTSWLGTIALRKAIDANRKRQKEPVKVEVTGVVIPSQEYTDETVLLKEQKDQVGSVIQRLPIKYGSILKKFYYQEKSYSEIAKEEGVAVKTIETRLYRGKQLLKKLWQEGEQDGLS